MPLLSQTEKEIRRMRQSLGVGVADSQPGKNDMNDGQQQLAVIDGVVTDVKKVNGELYHNRIFTSFQEEVDSILNEESVIKVQHKFTGNPVIDPGFQSDTFASGFGGSGYRINKDASAYNIEIDNMTIRGTLSVYELLIQQIRATNGSIFVTSAAKVASSSGLSASSDSGTIDFDDPSGKSLCPFAKGDIIMMQRVDPGATVAQNAAATVTGGMVKKLVYAVTAVSGVQVTVVQNSSFNNISYPVEGDEFVRIGNIGTAGGADGTDNRDGVIYLTSDDSNAPYIDIKSSVNSYAEWYGNVPKVRLGNLAGITYDSVSLSGYGLYSENVFLTGKIIATSGEIGGVKLGADKIYVGTGTVNNTNTGFYLDDSGNFSLKDKLYWNGTTLAINGGGTFSGALSAASGTFGGALSGGTISIGSSNSIFKADSDGIYLGNATFGSAPFRVTPDGQLTATSGTFSGSITGASGVFGGTLTIGTGSNTVKASTDGLQVGHGTFGSAPFRVTSAGAVTATNIVLTAQTGSSFATGASSNVNISTAGNTKLAQGRFEFQETGDLLIKPLAADATGNTRRGLIFTEYLDGSGNWSDYWMQYHDSGTATDTNQLNFLYNGSNKAVIDTDGMVRSNNGFREGISSAASECEIHNNEVQIYANVSDNARWFQVRNTDTTPENDHRMGGLRCYATAHSVLTNNSGWNGLVYFQTPDTGSAADLTGMVSLGFRAGDSATAKWWKFAYNGSSYNAKDDADWDTSSDERVKENITNVSSALTTLDALRPVTFNFTDDFVAKTDFPSSKKWGFVAQEFKNVISEGVTIKPQHNYDDFHSLNASMLVPILVKAVQELKAEVEQLKSSD